MAIFVYYHVLVCVLQLKSAGNRAFILLCSFQRRVRCFFFLSFLLNDCGQRLLFSRVFAIGVGIIKIMLSKKYDLNNTKGVLFFFFLDVKYKYIILSNFAFGRYPNLLYLIRFYIIIGLKKKKKMYNYVDWPLKLNVFGIFGFNVSS